MNMTNFKLVLAQIEAHLETWDQREVHSWDGTKHCFAGWCQIFALGGTVKHGVPFNSVPGAMFIHQQAIKQAIKFLDVSWEVAMYLFSYDRSLEDFRTFAAKVQ